MKDTKRIWVWVGVAVVVIGVIIAFVWRPSGNAPATSNSTTHPVTYAKPGQIVPSFPSNLILDANTSTVSSSYAIAYSSSTRQATAVFNSTTSMQGLYTAYMEYFADYNWTVVSNVIKYPDSRGIEAENSFGSVGVSIIAQGKGSQATVTYLTK